MASNLTSTLSPALNRLNPEPNRFRQAQEDLFRPLKEAMKQDDPMGAVMSLPQMPQQQQEYQQQQMSKRARKLLDQRRNWAFTDLNDLYPEPTIEEALGISETEPGAQDKTSTSVVQQYLERKDKKSLTDRDQKPAHYYGAYEEDFTGRPELKQLSAMVPGADENFFRRKIISPRDSDKSVAGFGDPGKFQLVSDPEAELQKKHREEFGRLLDPNAPKIQPAQNLFADPAHFERPTLFGQDNNANPTQATPAASQPHRSVLYPLGVTDPTANALHSSVFDDPTAATLGLPNPTPVKTEAPAVTVESIKNMVDPFTANMAKRKF